MLRKPAAGALILVLMLGLGLRDALKRPSAPSPSQNRFNRDQRAALDWLRENSSRDAVVLAHWRRSRAIIALAQRRVLLPGEFSRSEEQAAQARQTDIARFFFAEDEAEALAIAGRYGASFVLADRAFPAKLCELAERCEYAAPGFGPPSLNPLGLKKTIAGRMSQGAELRSFKRVWLSADFAIYEVGGRDPLLSPAEKRLALRIARQTIASIIADGRAPEPQEFHPLLAKSGAGAKFRARRPASVGVWSDGELRSSPWMSGHSLLVNLIEAAAAVAQAPSRLALGNEELAAASIEVTLSRQDFSPLPREMIGPDLADPAAAYRLADGQGGGRVLPAFYLSGPPRRFNGWLADLCRQSGLSAECYLRSPVERFSVEDFVEGPRGGPPQDLSGSAAAIGADLSAPALRERLRSASRWLLQRQKATGAFAASLEPRTGLESQVFDFAGNAWASLALLEAYRALGDEKLLSAAERNAGYLAANVQRDFKPEHPHLEALVDLELFEILRDPGYLERADELVHRPSSPQADAPPSKSLKHLQFLATARLNKHKRDEKDLRNLLWLSTDCIQEFREARSSAKNLEPYSWLSEGFEALYGLTRDQRHADFALEIADWQMDRQFLSGKAGAGESRAVGGLAASIAGACGFARSLALERPARRCQESLTESLRWLTRMQITPESDYFIPARNRASALGGVRTDFLDSREELYGASYFVLGASRYLRGGRLP